MDDRHENETGRVTQTTEPEPTVGSGPEGPLPRGCYVPGRPRLCSPNPLFLPLASDHFVLLHVTSINSRFWEGVGFCTKISWAACRWVLGLPGSLPTVFQNEIALQIPSPLIFVTIKDLEFLF